MEALSAILGNTPFYFFELTVIVNQQGTLRIVYGRVDPSSYHLIRILSMEA